VTSYVRTYDIQGIPSWKLTYPHKKALLKMIFLFPRRDMLVPWRVVVGRHVRVTLNIIPSS